MGTRIGPYVKPAETHCRGCVHLDTVKSYGSNDYVEVDYVCRHPGNGASPEHGYRYLPGAEVDDRTPDWCPVLPATDIDNPQPGG